MDIHNWKIFNKRGSFINWYRDSYLNLQFVTDTTNAIGGEAFCLTDPSGIINEVIVAKPGWNYNPANTTAILQYTFAVGNASYALSPAEASINFQDVSIFSPDPTNTYGIGSVNMDLSTNFIYPAVSYSGAFFLDPVAVGLVETEHLTILQETSTGNYIRPYDPTSQLVFRFIESDEQIKLFEVNNDEQIIEWTDEIVFDTSVYVGRMPITINIGFKSEDEGVYERRLRVYERRDGQDNILAEFVVNAQSIGQEERFDTLLQDLAPMLNAKNIPHMFKEANINEELPDWQLLNYKSKHAVLEYSQITPYIGSYKALINSIKWLGYEDIKVKEWFRDVKEDKKLGLYVPYDAEERTKTILYFSAEERRNLKKLNELSLIYCINRDTGEIDEWGNPETVNCYEYNLNEILTKLFSLKKWLEKNIIGVHASIVDLTGEGIYYERFRNILYGTQDIGTRANYTQSLTPITLGDDSELIRGDASISLTLREYEKSTFKDLADFRFGDFIDYGYTKDPSVYDASEGTIPSDSSILNDFDANLVRVGATYRNPFYNLYDIQWRASVSKVESGVLTDQFIDNPLWIYDNTIRWYDILKEESTFYDVSTNLDILLEKAYIRDASNDIWEESIAYSIYPDASLNGTYWMESSTGVMTSFNGFAIFHPWDASGVLQYKVDDNYMVPLLKMKNYRYTDSSGVTQVLEQDKEFNLDIVDGKIAMDASLVTPDSQILDTTQYINFNYDTSIDEQEIRLNVVYNSPRMPLYQYEPSIYYHLTVDTPYSDPAASLIIDNSVYKMHVNHIGDYELEVFGWDGYNVLYNNIYKENDGNYEVWTKYPTIVSYIDTSVSSHTEHGLTGDNRIPYDASIPYLAIGDTLALYNNNLRPIFDRAFPLQGLDFRINGEGVPYIEVPSITFFQNLPEQGSLSNFYNLTERVVTIADPVTIDIDPDFQTFIIDDSINIVLFDKQSYSAVDQSINVITNVVGNTLTLNNALGSNFIIDESTSMYIQNDSLRNTSNIINDDVNRTLTLDVSNYTFGQNQLISLIIENASTGFSWGSAFRVLDVCTNGIEHRLEGNIPSFILDASLEYTIKGKHAFSTYANFQIEVDSASEIDNTFNIYHNDTYYHQYYLDDTFVITNLLFDHDMVREQWYDPSDNLINRIYWPFHQAIEVDISTLVILDAQYDPSNYMLRQKNIWSMTRFEDDNKLVMKVFNNQVFYVFDEPGTYNITAEAYDHYGNLKTQTYEGLLEIVDPEERNEINLTLCGAEFPAEFPAAFDCDFV